MIDDASLNTIKGDQFFPHSMLKFLYSTTMKIDMHAPNFYVII